MSALTPNAATAELEAAEAILQMNIAMSHSPVAIGGPLRGPTSQGYQPISGSAVDVSPGYRPLPLTTTANPATATATSKGCSRTVACWSCRRFRKKCINAANGTPCTRCAHRGETCTYIYEQREAPANVSEHLDQVKAEAPSSSILSSNLKRSSASEAQLIQGFKKRKKAVSCMSCYAKKLKCCRSKPSCAACSKRGSSCFYNDEVSVPSAKGNGSEPGKLVGSAAANVVNSSLNSSSEQPRPIIATQAFMQSAAAPLPRLSFVPRRFNPSGAEFPPVAPSGTNCLSVESKQQERISTLPSHQSTSLHQDLPLKTTAGLAPGVSRSYFIPEAPPFTSLLKPVHQQHQHQQEQSLPSISHIFKSWDALSNPSTNKDFPRHHGILPPPVPPNTNNPDGLLPPLVQTDESVSPEAGFNTNEPMFHPPPQSSPVMSQSHANLSTSDKPSPTNMGDFSAPPAAESTILRLLDSRFPKLKPGRKKGAPYKSF
ncbi:UNVERIFIED_CONTAM: hypothetical protein HDU68_007969 [Siphonaria sp. JEL0065]|nr:hypothetical protein HDU68_007969 [Siphonaria sp. JEL0065]